MSLRDYAKSLTENINEEYIETLDAFASGTFRGIRNLPKVLKPGEVNASRRRKIL